MEIRRRTFEENMVVEESFFRDDLDSREVVVSVKCMTYNHENFIRQALDGFVMQQTDFRFEVLVHDDASTDRTAEIVAEYAEKYPSIIKPIYEIENQYKHKTHHKPVDIRLRGRYVAYCEGDDYWTDPLKLQKQVDFLDANPDCALVFHEVVTHWEDSDQNDEVYITFKEGDYDFMDVLNHCPIQTASIVLRKSIFDTKEYFEATKISVCGDLAIYMTCAHFGFLHGINQPMSVYRKHPGGISRSIYTGETFFRYMTQLERIPMIFGKKYIPKVKEIVCSRYQSNFLAFLKQGKIKPAFRSLGRSLKLSTKQTFKEFGKYFLYKLRLKNCKI